MPALIDNLGGPDGFGTQSLGPDDDGSSAALDITGVFGGGLNLFGVTYDQIYINNNGNITFSSPLSDYTPASIGAGYTAPIIAPFWADVDTRGGPTTPTGGNSTGSNNVWYDLDDADRTVTITWDDVGYYGAETDKVDAFQLQLIGEGNGNFEIKFIYQNISWVTGDASGGTDGLGGTPARAGYSAGNGVDYFELPQSGDQDQLLSLPTAIGNTGQPGIWEFQAQNGSVLEPMAVASAFPGGGDSTVLVITGQGLPGATVTLDDGTIPVGSAVVAADNTWSVTTSALAPGGHSLSATETGSSGEAFSPLSVTILTSDTSVASGTTVSTVIEPGSLFLNILAGAEAIDTVLESTAVDYVQSGGTSFDTVILSGGDEFVESGGTAIGTVADGGSQVVYGAASGTVLNSGSYLYLEAGTAVGTVVNSGVAVVYGAASGTTDNSGGFDFVFSGGSVTGTVVDGGDEYVETGASATGTVVEGGAQIVYGTVTGTVLDSGTSAYFEPGSIADGVTVDGGLAVIYGNAGATTVEGGGYDYVERGGSAAGTVLSGGDEYVEFGAVASGTVVDGGVQVDFGSTIATTINGGGYEYVESGGVAVGTIVNSGVESIFGTASGTVDGNGGADYVNAGSASGTVIGNGGGEFVEAGATAVGTTVSGGGAQIVYGTASAAVVDGGGSQYIAPGGTAAGTVISGGTVELAAGAVAGAGAFTFAGGGGTLHLDAAVRFSGFVAGFGGSDQIDLSDIPFTTGAVLFPQAGNGGRSGGSTTISTFQEAPGDTSGTLTVGNATDTANITLLGQYAAGQFQLASDGNGGTLVTAPTAPAATDLAASLLATPGHA